MHITLTWGDIALTSVIGSILTTIVGLLVYRSNKAVDFRKDYNKILLSKRLQAYEKLESVMMKLNITEDIPISPKLRLPALEIYSRHEDEKATRFYQILRELYDIWNYSTWIQNDILDRAKELYQFLLEDYVKIKEDFRNPFTEQLGTVSYPDINLMTREISVAILADIQSMDNIAQYLNKKNEGYENRLKKARQVYISIPRPPGWQERIKRQF